MPVSDSTSQTPAMVSEAKHDTFEKGGFQRSPATALTEVSTLEMFLGGLAFFVLGETVIDFLLGEQPAPERGPVVHSDGTGATSEESAMESVQIPGFLLSSSLVAAAVGQHHDHPSPKVFKEPK